MRTWPAAHAARIVARAATVSALVLGGAFTPAAGAQAASPSASSLAGVPSTVAWTGGPLTGTAPVERQVSCLPATCDDFTLNVGRVAADTVLTIRARTTGSNRIALAIFAPDCDPAPGPPCYAGFGPDTGLTSVGASYVHPAPGRYLVRVACGICAGATYAARATLAPLATSLAASPRSGIQFGGQALAYSGANQQGEPGISISGGGLAIANSFGPTVWVSHDSGRSWGAGNGALDPSGCPSQDADAVAATDGTLYAVNLCAAGLSNLVFRSVDGGKTWNSDRAGLPVVAGTDSDRPWLTADPRTPGTVYLVYHSAGAVLASDYRVHVLRSTDRAASFTELTSPSAVDPTATLDTALGGDVVNRLLVDPRDSRRLYLVWAGGPASVGPPGGADPGFTRIMVDVSTDAGQTWHTRSVFDAGLDTVGHIWPASAIGPDGLLSVAFSERRTGSTETHVLVTSSGNGGATWSRPFQVDGGGLRSNLLPAIAAPGPGRVDVLWEGSLAPDYSDTGALWSVMFAQVTGAGGNQPAAAAAVVSPLNHAGDICIAGAVGCQVRNSNPVLADFISLAVDRSGRALATWTDDVHGVAPVIMLARQSTAPILLPPAPPRVTPLAGALPSTTAIGGTDAAALALVLAAVAAAIGAARLTRKTT